MSKGVMYLVAAVVFVGIGALVAGLSIWYHHPNLNKEPLVSEARYARCVLQSPDGRVTGSLYLQQARSLAPVLISGNITGLTPGKHGFHVHQWGVEGNDCKSTGGHYNPLGYDHSAPNATERHVGDLGNVEAQTTTTRNTVANVVITDKVLTLSDQYSIVGRAIVVHADEDDLGMGGNDGSLKTGNAGGRVACCTLYLSEAPKP
uniref:superoxide dismutase n=1 Tax=Callinectes sapidus TaxID=6763 RepID=G8E4V4_CALSI|nr:copper zinc superoxide dismutase [Callinectes sapidus]